MQQGKIGRKAAAPRRWRRRKEARPAEIVAAALEIFEERGFAAARLDEVATRAGVSKGTLYLYFSSKEELFRAVVRQALIPVIAGAERIAGKSDRPTAALLADVLGAMAQAMMRSRVGVIPKLVIAEAGNFPDLARFYYEEAASRGLRMLEGVLRRGVERGELRPLDTQHVARLVIAPMLLLLVWKTTFERHAGAPLDAAGFIEAHLDVLMRGIAAPGAGA